MNGDKEFYPMSPFSIFVEIFFKFTILQKIFNSLIVLSSQKLSVFVENQSIFEICI